ncbi:hypothetical protein D0810_18415 [Vibrio cholerae]|nr:hypothetical protein [Vibrio cholerae]EGR0080368.1 hypothetical protein [Vibrio cholerae]EGR0900895.1 hypothetical protein [Vibrio cholerae]EGR2141829.1 hypothetical protein [Vibrio cholerae]EGR2283706.1 hypothetical protein [Vibrio cholerae]
MRLNKHNKRLKRDCQRAAFPVPLSRGGFGGCVWVWLLCVVSPLGRRYVIEHKQKQPFWCGLYYR